MARFSVHTGTIAPDPVVPGAVPVRAPPRCSAMTAPARAETRSCMHQTAGLQPREPKSPPPDEHACRFQLQRLGRHRAGPPTSTLPPFCCLCSKRGLPSAASPRPRLLSVRSAASAFSQGSAFLHVFVNAYALPIQTSVSLPQSRRGTFIGISSQNPLAGAVLLVGGLVLFGWNHPDGLQIKW